jgi:hypothetical protein
LALVDLENNKKVVSTQIECEIESGCIRFFSQARSKQKKKVKANILLERREMK